MYYNTRSPSGTVPAGIYLLKVNNRNTRTRCEICSKLTMKTPERLQWRCSGRRIVNFEHVSHLVLVLLLLTLNLQLQPGVFIIFNPLMSKRSHILKKTAV